MPSSNWLVKTATRCGAVLTKLRQRSTAARLLPVNGLVECARTCCAARIGSIRLAYGRGYERELERSLPAMCCAPSGPAMRPARRARAGGLLEPGATSCRAARLTDDAPRRTRCANAPACMRRRLEPRGERRSLDLSQLYGSYRVLMADWERFQRSESAIVCVYRRRQATGGRLQSWARGWGTCS